MPRPYTRTRFRIMQGVMWGLLALVTGLAAAMVQFQRGAQQVKLAQAVAVDGVSIRLPEGWRQRGREGAEPSLLARAMAPRGGQVISVWQDEEANGSAADHLARRFELPVEAEAIEVVRVAGWAGAMLSVELQLPGADEMTRSETYAAAVLPDGRAITVSVSGPGESHTRSEQVTKQVAENLGVQEEPRLADGPVELAGGARIALPAGYRAVAETDGSIVQRRLWAGSDEPVIELVPCIVRAGDGDAMKAQVAMFVLARGEVWRGATISPAGEGAWRAASVTEPMTAWVVANQDGRAVLAVVSTAGAAADAVWARLASGIEWTSGMDVEAMESAGAEAAAGMRGGLDAALREEHEAKWWVWVDRNGVQRGWSRLDWHGERSAELTAIRQRSDGRMERATERSTVAGDASTYVSDGTWSRRGDSRATAREVHVELRNGTVGLSSTSNGRTVANWKAPARENYVPGGVLPLVMGRLPRRAMVLSSDSFVEHEAMGGAGLLEILIEPGEPLTTNPVAGGPPLRCVQAQVNGSGRVSRWYFNEQGELEQVTFARGITRVNSAVYEFPGDGPEIHSPGM